MVILGLVLGAIQAIAPEAIKYFQDSKDKKHELEIMQLQMQMQKDGMNGRLEEIKINAQQAEVAALQSSYRAELKYSGKYSASVRPTVTYMAMSLYLIQKLLLICAVIFSPTLPWLSQTQQLSSVAMVVWTAFDETLLGWIIVFWFGSRSLKKA